MAAKPSFDPAEQYRKLSHEWFRAHGPDSPFVPRDWADDLIKGADDWIESSEIPEWLHLRIANVPNVLLQLPKPDDRWVLQFRGVFLGPFDFRLAGWRDAHDSISARITSLAAKVKLEQREWLARRLSAVQARVVRINAVSGVAMKPRTGEVFRFSSARLRISVR